MGDVGEGEGGGESGAFLQNALIHMHCIGECAPTLSALNHQS